MYDLIPVFLGVYNSRPGIIHGSVSQNFNKKRQKRRSESSSKEQNKRFYNGCARYSSCHIQSYFINQIIVKSKIARSHKRDGR